MCTNLDLSNFAFSVTLDNTKFTIPFQNLVMQSTISNLPYCNLFIVQNYNNDQNVLELGDPFFSAFLPVFDVDNEMMGLAIASRGIEGSTIEDVTPADPTSNSVAEHLV